jgi:orotate phosphoribosyltransferase
MSESEKKLLSMLANISYNYSPTPSFRLASGKMSRFYIDCKTTTLTPEGLVLIGKVLFERIKDLPIQAVGGLEFGAIPLALATSIYAFEQGVTIHPFVVRKQAKDRGLKKAIEGQLSQGDLVVVLEDVVTTGASSLLAVERLRDADIKVDHILAIVDRVEGGTEAIAKAGLNLVSIFNMDDLHHALSAT